MWLLWKCLETWFAPERHLIEAVKSNTDSQECSDLDNRKSHRPGLSRTRSSCPSYCTPSRLQRSRRGRSWTSSRCRLQLLRCRQSCRRTRSLSVVAGMISVEWRNMHLNYIKVSLFLRTVIQWIIVWNIETNHMQNMGFILHVDVTP